MDPAPSIAQQPLKVLLVEDNEHDPLAFRRSLNKGGIPFACEEFEKAEDALGRLAHQGPGFDIAVVDYSLPGMNGLQFCHEAGRMVPLPTIMLTGVGSEELAVKCLKSGVDDYLIKDAQAGYLELLPLVLQEVLNRRAEKAARRKAEEDLSASHRLWRRVLASLQEAVFVLDPLDGRIADCNECCRDLFGFSREELLGQTLDKLFADQNSLKQHLSMVRRACRNGHPARSEFDMRRESGEPFITENLVSLLNGKDQAIWRLVYVVRDISEQKSAEQERERLITELSEALRKVKKLSGLLPICASCKKIRDDEGYWQHVEQYIRDHSEAEFSHGICPTCQKELYGDIFK